MCKLRRTASALLTSVARRWRWPDQPSGQAPGRPGSTGHDGKLKSGRDGGKNAATSSAGGPATRAGRGRRRGVRWRERGGRARERQIRARTLCTDGDGAGLAGGGAFAGVGSGGGRGIGKFAQGPYATWAGAGLATAGRSPEGRRGRGAGSANPCKDLMQRGPVPGWRRRGVRRREAAGGRGIGKFVQGPYATWAGAGLAAAGRSLEGAAGGREGIGKFVQGPYATWAGAGTGGGGAVRRRELAGGARESANPCKDLMQRAPVAGLAAGGGVGAGGGAVGADRGIRKSVQRPYATGPVHGLARHVGGRTLRAKPGRQSGRGEGGETANSCKDPIEQSIIREKRWEGLVRARATTAGERPSRSPGRQLPGCARRVERSAGESVLDTTGAALGSSPRGCPCNGGSRRMRDAVPRGRAMRTGRNLQIRANDPIWISPFASR